MSTRKRIKEIKKCKEDSLVIKTIRGLALDKHRPVGQDLIKPGVLYVNIIDDYWQAAYEERPVRDIVFYDPIIVGEDGVIYRYVKPPASDDETDEDMLPEDLPEEDLPDEDLPHEELPIEKKVEEEGLLKAAGSLMKQVVGGLVISALKAEALQLFS